MAIAIDKKVSSLVAEKSIHAIADTVNAKKDKYSQLQIRQSGCGRFNLLLIAN
jgi:hypothetical protein